MSQEKPDGLTESAPEPREGIPRHADYPMLAKKAEAQGDWKSAAYYYAQAVEQHSAQLALIHSVQEGLSSKLEMQAIYDLVGDHLRDTFNAQVVMISQFDPATSTIFHHYAIERGQHLHILGWHPVDTSRLEIVHTGKPFMINLQEILSLIQAEKMHVIPGTELPKTWLGVPMLVGNGVKGIVSLQNLDKENAFSVSDIDLLTTLTNSMSASLENARLFNETQRLLTLMEKEMDIARQTQLRILPMQLPRHPGYDFGADMVPARAVGGDFYDFIFLNDQKLCIVVGDASDKGLPAALFMAMTFSLVRAETSRSHNQRQIMRNVNHFLTHLNDSSMFVTLLYCILDYATGEFSYSRAGHPTPILIDSQGSSIHLAMNRGQPLGIFEDVIIDEQQGVLPQGGLLLLHSDGLTEATDAHGQEYGLQRIQTVLAAHRDESAQNICEKLWLAVRSHSGEFPHQDDFTALIVKRA